MNLNKTTIRLTLGISLIVAAFYLRLNDASAQHDMNSMPGMNATPTPGSTAPPSPTPSPKPSATPADTPADAPTPGHDVSSMPGMSPAGSPAPKPAGNSPAQGDMTNMPGMKSGAEKKQMSDMPAGQDMSSMPGMKSGESSKKDMSGMPGMKLGDDMSNMPGMKPGADKKGMSDMSGMSGMDKMQGMGGAPSGQPRISAPGVRVLGPSRKWNPRPEDDRSDELQPLGQLKAHMEPFPPPVAGPMIHSLVITEILEHRFNSSGPNTFNWDILGWVGTDRNRFWYKTEGSQQLSGDQTGKADLQLLYGRMIAPNWDFQVGARAQRGLGTASADTRTYAVIGVQGLAPYQFDIEPSIFISDQGQVSARLTLLFDLLLTQRLVLQPRFETAAAIQSDKKFGMGSGVNETGLGLRLRYEIRREVAPYVGLLWSRQYGQTASLAREGGESTDSIALVTGLQLWW